MTHDMFQWICIVALALFAALDKQAALRYMRTNTQKWRDHMDGHTPGL